jgi:hypothetical protein
VATNPYTVARLLADLRRRGQIPESSDRSFSTDDLVAMVSDETQSYMAQLLMSVREEFFVTDYDVTTVANQSGYRIPPRAVGSKVRQVLVSNGSGYQILQRVEPRAKWDYQFSGAGAPVAYFLKGTTIELLPTPSAGLTLRMQYFRRPNTVVYDDECGLITAINTGTRVVTISASVDDFSSSETYDFIRGEPGFETLAMDQAAAVSGGGTTLTFTNTLPTDLAVGDYVALAGQTPIPQLPVEMHQLLAQRTVVKVLEAMGDPKVSTAKSMCDEERARALTMLTPRSEGDSKYIINHHGPGWGRWFRW